MRGLTATDFLFVCAAFAILEMCSGYSSGGGEAQTCDALYLCGRTEPRICPPGMDKVQPPVRSQNYSVFATTYTSSGATQTSEYVPGELVNIHVNVLHKDMKYIGLLMYAVDSTNTRVGDWDIPLENPPIFYKPSEAPCRNKSVMHYGAELKRYRHILRFQGPPAGTGVVTIRTLLKQGETNGGAFYWPNLQGDLQLSEGSASSTSSVHWYHGLPGENCHSVCQAYSGTCDTSAWPKALAHGAQSFLAAVSSRYTCKFPLLSSCNTPHGDTKDFCWYRDTTICSTTTVDHCASCTAGARLFCPCSGTNGAASIRAANTGTSTQCGTRSYRGRRQLHPLLRTQPQQVHPQVLAMPSTRTKRSLQRATLPLFLLCWHWCLCCCAFAVS